MGGKNSLWLEQLDYSHLLNNVFWNHVQPKIWNLTYKWTLLKVDWVVWTVFILTSTFFNREKEKHLFWMLYKHNHVFFYSFVLVIYLLILVVKPRILIKANLITILARNPMVRRHRRKFQFGFGRKTQAPQKYSRESPRSQVVWNPNPHRAPTGFELGS